MKFGTDVYKKVLFNDFVLRENTLNESPAFLMGVNEFLCMLSIIYSLMWVKFHVRGMVRR